MTTVEETVNNKLSSLNETQDSIVTVAQYVLFHRRSADRVAQIWLERLKASNSTKKLNMIYLANEIMQQAKAKNKQEFLHAFMPVMADAVSSAYKGATQEVQNKIRRVVEVWRDRKILDDGIQVATESRIDELDKSRPSKGGARLGGALFSGASVPTELQPLTKLHAAVSKAETAARPLASKADTDYTEQTKPDAPIPSAPVQAGRLSALMKSLATAESAVNESIKARTELVLGLEQLLKTHREKLADEEVSQSTLSTRRAEIEAKRKEVEDIIFRRVSAEDAAQKAATAPTEPIAENEGTANGDANRSPEVEGFTPPPPDVETFTPTGSPNLAAQPQAVADGLNQDPLESDTMAADTIQELPVQDEPTPSFEPPPAIETDQTNGSSAPGLDILASLGLPSVRPSSAVNGSGTQDPRKRRKMSHKTDMEEQVFGTGDGVGLDADVAASLGAQ